MTDTLDPTALSPITTGYVYRVYHAEWPWFMMRLLDHPATEKFSTIKQSRRSAATEFGLSSPPPPELDALYEELKAGRQPTPMGYSMLPRWANGKGEMVHAPSQTDADRLFGRLPIK